MYLSLPSTSVSRPVIRAASARNEYLPQSNVCVHHALGSFLVKPAPDCCGSIPNVKCLLCRGPLDKLRIRESEAYMSRRLDAISTYPPVCPLEKTVQNLDHWSHFPHPGLFSHSLSILIFPVSFSIYNPEGSLLVLATAFVSLFFSKFLDNAQSPLASGRERATSLFPS